MHAATPWAFPLRRGCRAALPEAILPVVHRWFARERGRAAGIPALLTSDRFAHFRPHLAHDDAPKTGLNRAKVQIRPLCVAPRDGIEPSSLVLIQSQAGPASRPTGERPACAGLW